MDPLRTLCTLWENELSKGIKGVEIGPQKLHKIKQGLSLSVDNVRNDLIKKEVENGVDKLDLEKITSVSFGYYADDLVEKFHKAIQDEDKIFLQDEVHVEVLGRAVFLREFYYPMECHLYKLYEDIEKVKINRAKGEGGCWSETTEIEDSDIERVRRFLQGAALEQLLPRSRHLMESSSLPRKLKKLVGQLGLMEDVDVQRRFRHKSYAQYFLSSWLVQNFEDERVQKILVQNIFTKTKEFKTTRKFLNSYLESRRSVGKLSINVLKEANYFADDEEGVGSNIHLLAKERLAALLSFLTDYVHVLPVTIVNAMLRPNTEKRNVLHVASKAGSQHTLALLLEFAEKNMSPNDMEDLLFSRDEDGLIPFHLAVKYDRVNCLRSFLAHEYRRCSNKVKGSFAIELKMFGVSPLMWTALNNRLRTFRELISLIQEHFGERKLGQMFSRPHDRIDTILHAAVSECQQEIAREVWRVARRVLGEAAMKDFVMMKNEAGQTILQTAAAGGFIASVVEAWSFATSVLEESQLKCILVAADNDGNSVLHTATLQKGVEVVEYVVQLMKRNLSHQEVQELLTRVNVAGESIFHTSIAGGRFELFILVWNLVDELVDSECREDLMGKKDGSGSNFLLKAASSEISTGEMPIKVFRLAKRAVDRISWCSLLMDLNHRHENVFLTAALRGHLCLVNECWFAINDTHDCVGMALLFDQTDVNGNSLLHLSAKCGDPKVLEKILGYADSVLGVAPLVNFLNKSNFSGKTCLQIALSKGHVEFSEHLEHFCKTYMIPIH